MTAIRKLERQQVVCEHHLEDIERLVAEARAGNVTSLFVVADMGPDREIYTVASFDDRLRALGALEMLKNGIHRSE